MKIIVGVSTYGTFPRVNRFIRSYWGNTEKLDNHELIHVCCDDGTPDLTAVREREKFCKAWNFNFIRNEKNLGIPATWNNLASFDPDADLAVILNDDVTPLTAGWLTRLVHFFENNEKIGTVGLPLVNEGRFNDHDSRWLGNPGRVGAAVGCAFAVRPKDLFLIKNPDNSMGYWSDLIAFHEEVHLGFKLSEQGLLSIMLPWPPLWHQGGQTFAANPELSWRDPSDYLPMEEFLEWARQSRWYYSDFEKEYETGIADRMGYSRTMFSKYWGILDECRAGRMMQEIKGEIVNILDEPQKFVHPKVVDIWPPRMVKWLDKAGKEQETEV